MPPNTVSAVSSSMTAKMLTIVKRGSEGIGPRARAGALDPTWNKTATGRSRGRSSRSHLRDHCLMTRARSCFSMPEGWDAAAGGFPAMTGNVPFQMKDVVLLAVSLYLSRVQERHGRYAGAM